MLSQGLQLMDLLALLLAWTTGHLLAPTSPRELMATIVVAAGYPAHLGRCRSLPDVTVVRGLVLVRGRFESSKFGHDPNMLGTCVLTEELGSCVGKERITSRVGNVTLTPSTSLSLRARSEALVLPQRAPCGSPKRS